MLPKLTLPFPQTNFQPLLAQIPGLGVDVVGSFFAGGGAVQFVKEYAAAGLKVPLCGSGFLTEGTLERAGRRGRGHRDRAALRRRPRQSRRTPRFRRAFKDKAGRDADVYAVQGYDAAQLLGRRPRGRQGQHRGRGQPLQGDARSQDRQPARPDQHVAVAEGDAEHLPAQGRGRPEQGGRRRRREPRRPRHRLQAGLRLTRTPAR